MFKQIIIALGLTLSLSVQAQANTVIEEISASTFSALQLQSPFDWKVGDTASYKMNLGGFIQGSMVLSIKDVQPDSLTITQDMDLGFAGKQNCEQVLNPNTGEVKKFTCNGQDQQQPSQGEIEVVETKEATVTVPAGTFTCLYIKAQQKSDSSIIEQWVNPKQVPVFGMVKTIAPSQLGKITLELTSFKKM